MDKNRQLAVCCGFMLLLVATRSFVRETMTTLPILTYTILGYGVSFSLCHIWVKHLSRYKTIDKWNPIVYDGGFYRFLALAILIGTQVGSNRMGRVYAGNTLGGWGVDTWNAIMPFIVGVIMCKWKDTEMIITSLGTTLAMICGSVLMLPFVAFQSGGFAHCFGMISAVTSAAVCVLAHTILTHPQYSGHSNLSPVTLVMNLAPISAMSLIVPALFLESDLIFNHWTVPFGTVTLNSLFEGFLLAGTDVMMVQLLQNSPPSLAAGIWCLGNSIAIAIQSENIAMGGLCMVLLAFSVQAWLTVKQSQSLKDRLGPVEMSW